MRVAIVVGTQRPGSRSSRVGTYLASMLARQGVDSYILDLGATPMPLWDERLWEDGGGPWDPAWDQASHAIGACDAVIVISPEWGGMVPASLKNFFLICEHGELSHKPGLIVTVSSGSGGSYPVAELRMSSYKNTHICYLPDHVIVRDAAHVLASAEPASEADALLRRRIDWTLNLLVVYARAFQQIRGNPIVVDSPYKYGM